NSFDYRQQVVQALDQAFSADRPFSFRNELADAWYDLHNPDQTATPMTVRFTTTRDDFPPNLDNIRIQQLLLYFATRAGSVAEVDGVHLGFTEQSAGGAPTGSARPPGGEAGSLDGVISTRTGSAGSWSSLLGKRPFDEWELSLPDSPETRRLFQEEEI